MPFKIKFGEILLVNIVGFTISHVVIDCCEYDHSNYFLKSFENIAVHIILNTGILL
jgi:hypothetical protein